MREFKSDIHKTSQSDDYIKDNCALATKGKFKVFDNFVINNELNKFLSSFLNTSPKPPNRINKKKIFRTN
jgi:hypothetical protein